MKKLPGLIVLLACLAATAAAVLRYPLPQAPLAIALALYAAALWRWPALWLAVVPAVLPAYDLTPWSGWLFVTESDLFILVTIGVLAVRAPPTCADARLPGWRGAIVLLMLLAWTASTLRGLLLPPVAGGSSMPYLMPENALRLAKPLVEALALLPFLRVRQRTNGDVAARFAVGMCIGVVLVALAVIAERIAFVGLLDDTTDYRVVGPFSSMHVGGGHIGAFIALALPFLAVAAQRPTFLSLIGLLIASLGGAYTLAVSFARMAYGAAVVGLAVLGLGWPIARRRAGGGFVTTTLPLLLFALIGGAVAAVALGTTYMSARVASVVPDLRFREDNWATGLSFRDPGALTALFGMGLGTYPRTAFLRHVGDTDPSNFRVTTVGGRRALLLTDRSPFYFGQKISLPDDPTLHLTLAARSDQPGAKIAVLLCWKLLLYSDHCETAGLNLTRQGEWQDLSAGFPTRQLQPAAARSPIPPPVDLSLSIPQGVTVALTNLQLTGTSGGNILKNGDFSNGTARWYFTDDNHWRWRIFNQYLMTLFEGGVIGLAALLLLAGGALVSAVAALRAGEAMAAAVAAAITAFLCSCLVDALLEAPRLATLFYLVCLIGLALSPPPAPRPA